MLSRKIKQSKLTFALPLIGIAVGYLLFIILPNFREANKLRGSIQLKQAFIAKTDELREEIKEKEAIFARTKSYCDEWEETAPDDGSISSMHQQINQHVVDAGAVVTRFDPMASVPFESLQQSPLGLGAAGEFPQLFSLLAELESMPETIWLDQLRLTAAGKDMEHMNCEATLVIFAKKSDISD